MRRITLALLLFLLAVGFFWLGATAEAHYPNERATSEPWLMEEIALAKEFWTKRLPVAHHPENYCPDGISVKVADSLYDDDGINAIGRGSVCETWFRADLIRATRIRSNRWLKQKGLVEECHTVVHEMGHALGIALSRFISPNGAWLDQKTWTWHGEPVIVDGAWVGEWVDGHPNSGVMSNTNPVTPGDCVAWAKQKIKLRKGDGPCQVKKIRGRGRNRRITGACAT